MGAEKSKFTAGGFYLSICYEVANGTYDLGGSTIMKLKKLSSFTCCALLIASMTVPAPAPALAKSDTAKAIGAAIALGILGAAVAHHHREREYYEPHPVIGFDENAVGTCIHHADRIVRSAPGGLYVRLDRVKAVKRRDNGRTVVKAIMTGVYQWGQKPSDVRCVVKNHRVVKFDFN